MKRIKDAAIHAAMTIGLVLALAFGESVALADYPTAIDESGAHVSYPAPTANVPAAPIPG